MRALHLCGQFCIHSHKSNIPAASHALQVKLKLSNGEERYVEDASGGLSILLSRSKAVSNVGEYRRSNEYVKVFLQYMRRDVAEVLMSRCCCVTAKC